MIEEQRMAAMTERKRPTPAHQWPAAFFETEDKALPSGRAIPRGAPTLKAGDIVSFELGRGVEGPDYAMRVRREGGEA
jgi:hypothetical protein